MVRPVLSRQFLSFPVGTIDIRTIVTALSARVGRSLPAVGGRSGLLFRFALAFKCRPEEFPCLLKFQVDWYPCCFRHAVILTLMRHRRIVDRSEVGPRKEPLRFLEVTGSSYWN